MRPTRAAGMPMPAEDELRELAADIKQRGQLQPIMLDDQGRILDGRNRYAACELAGVKPEFETYDGDDPDGYALVVNVARRNLTVGQRAMIVARSQDCSSGTTQEAAARSAGVSRPAVAKARVVLKHAPDLVDEVIEGGKQLNAAYEEAQRNKDAVKSREAKLDELRKVAPDLAVLVDNEVRDLDDALKEAGHRATVAEVDKILTADEAPEPTFTSRAEAGAIGWTEAATLAQQWQRARGEHHRARAVHGCGGGGAREANPGDRSAGRQGATAGGRA